MRRAAAILLALGGCARAQAAPDGGDAWRDAWALATAWSLHDSRDAAKRLSADLGAQAPERPEPAAPTPTPLPPPAAPAPSPPAEPEAPPTDTLPPCNRWKACNELSLPARTVPVVNRSGRAPAPRGGAIAGGLYELTDAVFYTGLFGPSGPRGYEKRSAVAFPPAADPAQVIAQEVTEGDRCKDSSTLSVNVAGAKLTTFAICASTPCHDGCGGTVGYSATGGPSPTLQFVYPSGEVDTFTLRRRVSMPRRR